MFLPIWTVNNILTFFTDVVVLLLSKTCKLPHRALILNIERVRDF